MIAVLPLLQIGIACQGVLQDGEWLWRTYKGLVWHAVLCYGYVIYYISELVVSNYIEGVYRND